jgi:hypothetical protein
VFTSSCTAYSSCVVEEAWGGDRATNKAVIGFQQTKQLKLFRQIKVEKKREKSGCSGRFRRCTAGTAAKESKQGRFLAAATMASGVAPRDQPSNEASSAAGRLGEVIGALGHRTDGEKSGELGWVEGGLVGE